MALLPTTQPRWYRVNYAEANRDLDKGWMPQTTDIVRKRENNDVVDAWKVDPHNSHLVPSPPASVSSGTVRISNVKILTPLQVGGGSFPEGGVLPAQMGGIPCIPGSSLRGAFLSYILDRLPEMPEAEKTFWQSLIGSDRTGWQPRAIRFEILWLRTIQPFPLNPQQYWQVFGEPNNKLGIQWQVSPTAANEKALEVRVTLKEAPSQVESQYVQQRMQDMLRDRGIGRGTATGFGRLGNRTPDKQWEIRLTGMKPCIQPHIVRGGQVEQQGAYRWSPQVLRAHLRSYFTRIALAYLTREEATELTNMIFGGLGCRASLRLSSFLKQQGRGLNVPGQDYTNIPARKAHEVWNVQVCCNHEFVELVDGLLNLSSRLGGLGPGWRRPPHQLQRFNGFRGSEFSLDPCWQDTSIEQVVQRTYTIVRDLATQYGFHPSIQPVAVNGGIISIWQGNREQWNDIVHDVCSSQNANRPSWCGRTNERPSGYTVKQESDCCWIAVFDREVEATLREKGFQRTLEIR
jgi:hypothetical protein